MERGTGGQGEVPEMDVRSLSSLDSQSQLRVNMNLLDFSLLSPLPASFQGEERCTAPPAALRHPQPGDDQPQRSATPLAHARAPAGSRTRARAREAVHARERAADVQAYAHDDVARARRVPHAQALACTACTVTVPDAPSRTPMHPSAPAPPRDENERTKKKKTNTRTHTYLSILAMPDVVLNLCQRNSDMNSKELN